jgi:hypothetical protein
MRFHVTKRDHREALTKLLFEKKLITEAEFMQKRSAERAVYQAMLDRVSQESAC